MDEFEKQHAGSGDSEDLGLSRGRVVYFGTALAGLEEAQLISELLKHGFPGSLENIEARQDYKKLELASLHKPHIEMNLNERWIEFTALGELTVDDEQLGPGRFELRMRNWDKLDFNPTLKGSDALLNRLLASLGLRQQEPEDNQPAKSGFGIPQYLRLKQHGDHKLSLETRVEVVDIAALLQGCQWHAIYQVKQTN